MTTDEEEAIEDVFHVESDEEEIEDSVNNEKSACAEKIPFIAQEEVVIYRRRWFMLFIFSLNTAMNGCLFMCVSPINDIVRKHYNVPSVSIEWLPNMCVLGYVILALPTSYLIGKWGIRPIIFSAAICNFIATALHFAGYSKDMFYLVLMGQLFTALSYSTILQMPGKISSLWFPENERATATSIGVVMNLFGVAIGFLQPSLMVKISSDEREIEAELKTFFLFQLVMSAVILLLTLLYQEKPPTPPYAVSQRESIKFFDSLKLLWENKYFISLSQSYGIYFGSFVSIFVLVNPLITSKFRTGYEISVGWMGFWNNMIAMVAFVFIGRLLDRFHSYRLTAIVLNVMSMVVWLIFVIVLTNTSNFAALYAIYLLLGLCFVPYFAVGIEQAAEMTYPVSEETSSTVILLFGNVYAFVLIVVLGVLAQSEQIQIVGYVIAGLYFVSTILASLTKTDLNRLISESSNP